MDHSFNVAHSRGSTALASNCSYTKFLVDKDGVARKRYKPSFNPADFEAGAWARGMCAQCTQAALHT